MLMRKSGAAYRGFDFSEVAIRQAGSRTGRPELFSFADARDARSYAFDYDTIPQVRRDYPPFGFGYVACVAHSLRRY